MKRLSILVRLVFFEGRRNRGSVVKFEKRGSLIWLEAEAPLGAFCLGILDGNYVLRRRCGRVVLNGGVGLNI